MTETNDNALELMGNLVFIIQDDKVDDQTKLTQVQEFIEQNKGKGLDLNVKGLVDGRTVLHYAAEFGSPEMVDVLLTAGAHEHITDNDGAYPLHSATKNKKHPDVIRRLDVYARANGRDNKGRTPLHLAVEAGNLEAVQIMIDAGTDINAATKEGKTALALIEERLANETDENKKAELEGTKQLILKALKDKNTELEDAAVQEEASPTIAPATPTEEQTDATNSEKVEDSPKPVPEKESKPTDTLSDKLMMAIQSGNVEDVKKTLAELQQDPNFDINGQAADGITALHFAVINGTPEMVQALIEAKANVNIADNDGNTALHHAARYASLDEVKALIQAGAKVDAQNKEEKTALAVLEARIAEEQDANKKADLEKIKAELLNAQKAEANKKRPEPKGKPKPSRTGGGAGKPKPTTDRPPEAQGPTAGGTTPGTTGAQPAQEESGGIGHWLRNSMLGRWLGLDDESVAKRAQSARVLATYGEEGGGWFRNSMLGRWFGLDDASRIKKLQAENPTPVATPGTVTMGATYGAGSKVSTLTLGNPNASGHLGDNSGSNLTRETAGKNKIQPTTTHKSR